MLVKGTNLLKMYMLVYSGLNYTFKQEYDRLEDELVKAPCLLLEATNNRLKTLQWILDNWL